MELINTEPTYKDLRELVANLAHEINSEDPEFIKFVQRFFLESLGHPIKEAEPEVIQHWFKYFSELLADIKEHNKK